MSMFEANIDFEVFEDNIYLLKTKQVAEEHKEKEGANLEEKAP